MRPLYRPISTWQFEWFPKGWAGLHVSGLQNHIIGHSGGLHYGDFTGCHQKIALKK